MIATIFDIDGTLVESFGFDDEGLFKLQYIYENATGLKS